MVDLSPSTDEIQELMLSQLLQAECSELLLQRRRLRRDERMLQERLVSEEVRRGGQQAFDWQRCDQ